MCFSHCARSLPLKHHTCTRTCTRAAPTQATNLLRTLRSLREAAALGLLDGGGIGPAAGTASDAAALAALAGGGSGGDTELSRRVAALSRFVLEQMHRWAVHHVWYICCLYYMWYDM